MEHLLTTRESGQWYLRPDRAARIIIPLLALAVVAVIWLTTLQTHMGGSNDPSPDAAGLVGPLMDDSGEFVVAWHTWGVTHPPAYPLLNMLANILTRLFGLLGAQPVMAASLVSFTFGLAALGIMAWPIWQADRYGIGAATAILLPAFGLRIWLYASVAEVYSLGLLLGFGSLLLALSVGSHPRRKTALALGFVFGLSVGHHRTLALLIPALAIAAWPARRLGLKVWLGAAALAALSLGVYAYLPLAVIIGSPWVYGRSPTTLQGLLDAMLAREYMGQLYPSPTLGGLLLDWVGRVAFLTKEMTASGPVLGLLGLALALSMPSSRRLAIVLGLVAAGFVLAPVSQALLIGTHLPIMIASLALAEAYGLCVATITRYRGAVGLVGLLLSIMVSATVLFYHRDQILEYTRDPLGPRLIAAVAELGDDSPMVVETWGPRYYDLAYAKWVTGELAHIRLINAWANLTNLPPAETLPPMLYAPQDFWYVVGPETLAEHLGAPLVVESAGDGIIAIRHAPRIGINGAALPPTDGSSDVVLASARAWITTDQDVRVTLQWHALRRPALDYQVGVYVGGGEQISTPEDILAQEDRPAPVYGFYPTSRWSTNEQVRDDYRITMPNGRKPTVVMVRLYSRASDGTFTNYSSWNIPVGASADTP